MKLDRLALVAGAAAALALSGCKRGSEPESQDTGVAAPAIPAAGPDAKPGVTAGAARLVLPVVAGRPGVMYLRVTNATPARIMLSSVHVDGAGKAEMHRTSSSTMAAVKDVGIDPGAAIAFVPGGLHVMAFDVAPTLKAGDQTEATLTFSDGDKVSLPVKVEAMGAHDGMEGMHH